MKDIFILRNLEKNFTMEGTDLMNAYVTGADRGLGLALTEGLLERGFEVYAGQYGIDPKGLESLKKKFHVSLNIIPLDVSSDESVNEAANLIRQKTDRLDLLINNAGIVGDFIINLENSLNSNEISASSVSNNITWLNLEHSLDFNEMLRVYNVNALGPLRLTKSVYSLIKNSQLKMIANISSEAGSIYDTIQKNRKARYGYCMSKVALNMQSLIVSNHAKADQIKVYAIDPGYMRTFMQGYKNLSAHLEPEEVTVSILTLLLDKEKSDTVYVYADGRPREL